MEKNINRSFCVDFDSGLALPANLPFRHKQGHLRVDANVTIAAVLDYQTRDGSLISVLRHPDQIFHPRSLESLTGLPITISHPLEGDSYVDVTPDNFRKYGHGVTGDEIEDIKLTSPYVRIKGLNFQTKESLTALDSGNKELSPGYYISRIAESGVYDNRSYTHRQYGINVDSGELQDHITYNHLALMDIGENGRSGKGVKVLNLDNADVLISTGIKSDLHTKVFDLGSKQSKDNRKKMATKTIQFPIVNDKGITVNHNFEVDAADDIVIPATQFSDILGMLSEAKMQLENFTAVQTETAELLMPTGFDSVKAVVDAHDKLTGEIEVLRAEIAKKPTVDSSADNEGFKTRLSLVTDAIELVTDADKDSLIEMSKRQLQELIIKEWDSTKTLDTLSDGVIEGLYIGAKSTLTATVDSTKKSAANLANNADEQSNQILETDAASVNSRIAANRQAARNRRRTHVKA